MKIELLKKDNGTDYVRKTEDDGDVQIYILSPNEALIVGLIIGLQDLFETLVDNIK